MSVREITQTTENSQVIFEFEDFLRDQYVQEIASLIQQVETTDAETTPSLTVDFEKVQRYNDSLETADALAADSLEGGFIENPLTFYPSAREALRNFCTNDEHADLIDALPYDDADNPLRYADLRLKNIPNNRQIRNLRANDVPSMVAVEGRVKKKTEVHPRIDVAAYRCTTCDTVQEIPQPLLSDMDEPSGCTGECDGSVILDWGRSHKINFERIEVEESPENLKGGETPQSIEFFNRGDQTGLVSPGERVTVTGVLEPTSDNDSPVFDTRMRGVHVYREEEDYEDLTISDEDIERIKEIAHDTDVYRNVKDSIAPSIHGNENEKLACAMSLFGGVKKTRGGSYIRGDIHVFLVGDPGTAKSQILQYVHNISPRGVYTSGKGSSAAGLTATAVQESTMGGDQTWTLEAGALVLADKGIAAIDELDKMRQEDRDSLHEALEQQTVSVSKAGINATLKSRCSLVAAANPKYGRFDPYEPLGEQIELDPALVSRFELIFTITDTPEEKKDKKVADAIITANQAETDEDKADEIDAPISQEMFRKYVAYARTECNPSLPDEVADELRDFYVSIRNDGDGDAVPVTARNLQGLIRLAEASARMRLADEVTKEDAQRAINITKSSLEEVGTDPDTGEMDADLLETGTPKSQRDRIRFTMEILSALEEEHDGKVPFEALADTMEQNGIEEDTLEHTLEKLIRKGDVIEPSNNYYRLA